MSRTARFLVIPGSIFDRLLVITGHLLMVQMQLGFFDPPELNPYLLRRTCLCDK